MEEENELEEFSEELLDLLSRYGVNVADAESAMDIQRDAINEKSQEEEGDSDSGYASTRRKVADEPESNRAIRSIFDSLRKKR